MGAIIHVLMQVATQVQSGRKNIVSGEHTNSTDELHYELLKSLV